MVGNSKSTLKPGQRAFCVQISKERRTWEGWTKAGGLLGVNSSDQCIGAGPAAGILGRSSVHIYHTPRQLPSSCGYPAGYSIFPRLRFASHGPCTRPPARDSRCGLSYTTWDPLLPDDGAPLLYNGGGARRVHPHHGKHSIVAACILSVV